MAAAFDLAMAAFDPAEKESWYFGPMSREETNAILMSERDSGVFLVRDSVSIKGDFVLCVREDNKVSHYIINKIQAQGQVRFRIGDQEFPDLPSLLNFYKTHYLDTTSLIRPAPRETYKAKFDFTGRDPEDLPFSKGEILTILTKDEEQWWTAKNSNGKVGQVPVPYIDKFEPSQASLPDQEPPGYHDPQQLPASINGPRKLPARARVVQQRVPNAYDESQLRLEVGEILMVTQTNINGQWEGVLNGKPGNFPFTHVEFIESDAEDE